MLPFSIAFAMGLPAVLVGFTASTMPAAPADQQGAASGLLNTPPARVGAALGLTGVLLVAVAWTVSTGDAAGGLSAGFAITAGLAVAGIVCALVLFTRSGTASATDAAQPQGADRR